MPASAERIQLRDGRRLGFAEYGDLQGTPVFFFQGAPSSRLLHPDETITASLGVRLIQLERPGFGLSDFQPGRTLLDWPDDVAEVAAQLGIDRFAVVGLSAGGPYAAACAYKIPDQLTAVGMVGSMAPLDVPGLVKGLPRVRQAGVFVARYTPWLLRPLMWLLQNPQRDAERFFERHTAHNLEADQDLFAQPEFRAMLKANYVEATRNGIRGYAWEARILSLPWGFRLQDITMPVHLWHGEQDTSTPLAMAQYMAQVIPDCRTVYLPREGHFLLFSYWREILTTLLAR